MRPLLPGPGDPADTHTSLWSCLTLLHCSCSQVAYSLYVVMPILFLLLSLIAAVYSDVYILFTDVEPILPWPSEQEGICWMSLVRQYSSPVTLPHRCCGRITFPSSKIEKDYSWIRLHLNFIWLERKWGNKSVSFYLDFEDYGFWKLWHSADLLPILIASLNKGHSIQLDHLVCWLDVPVCYFGGVLYLYILSDNVIFQVPQCWQHKQGRWTDGTADPYPPPVVICLQPC